MSHGVEFANALWVTFTCTYPKSAKRSRKSFALFGSSLIKAEHKHVGEIDPWHTDEGLKINNDSV